MTRLALIAVAVVWMPLGSVQTQSVQDATGWDALTERLERAALKGDAGELRSVRIEALRLLTEPSSKGRESLLQYAVAYVAWRMAFQPGAPEKEQKDLLEDGVRRLQAMVKRDVRDAEAYSLLSGLYGSQIGKGANELVLGTRASDAAERASQLEPDNPRVLAQQGISAFHTPAMFGGGLDKADRLLRRSLERFAREPADKPWPNWGRFDAHVWLGQVLQKKRDLNGARAQYDRALTLAPESGWVKYSLLPSLERATK